MSEDRGKQKMTAALLAFFLGGFGVHHFYLGSSTSGIITLALVVVTCGAAGLLPFIEFIMLITMSDEDFDAKYNHREPEAMEFVFQKK
jgi:TM2 domain-containing membrane protein YozV